MKGKKVDVLGMGISNLPLIDMLLSAGAYVTVRDSRSVDELGKAASDFVDRGVHFITGKEYLEGIDGEVIFRSPGIRPDEKGIGNAVSRGALLSSEMELFLSMTDAEIFAITGSDGKTTTTTLTHLFLDAQKKRNGIGAAYVGGNIGKPLLPECEKMTSDDAAVLELSSFQLMTLSLSPKRAAITNITPNHLNWHLGMDEYIAAKKRVFDDNCTLVLNAENSETARIARERGENIILFSSKRSGYSEIVGDLKKNIKAVYLRGNAIVISDGKSEEELLDRTNILLPGIHNVENYMTAIALTYGYVDRDIYKTIAESFGGVEHRLELVRRLKNVAYYNSSIDSSPTRTAAALSALDGGKVVICGGYDKNIPFDTLATALCRHAHTVVLTGAAMNKIKTALSECPELEASGLTIIEEPDFTKAVTAASKAARAGDSVILSPACASFDAFKNFEERGNFFKNLVATL
ncbi:MAG: UDP-N-acetylmuramoyl-L-alanine--D-glutamate ligase [Ruminococcaceae bacterium]|nr:UDP-N-acetylmuramoyl-L-alanine--D-glutamate ligase [Oscillospiraceae bacterium]